MYNILTIQGGINVKEISSDQKIGSNIALIRKAKKMTQKDLARKIGISQPALGNYERGQRIIPASIFHSLPQILDVPLDFLVYGIPNNITFHDLATLDSVSLKKKAAHIENDRSIIERGLGRDDIKRHLLAAVLLDNYDHLVYPDESSNDKEHEQLKKFVWNTLDGLLTGVPITNEINFKQINEQFELLANTYLSLIIDEEANRYPAFRKDLPPFKEKLTQFLNDNGYFKILKK